MYDISVVKQVEEEDDDFKVVIVVLLVDMEEQKQKYLVVFKELIFGFVVFYSGVLFVFLKNDYELMFVEVENINFFVILVDCF